MPSREEKIAQLRSAIAAQERLRPTLGDAVTEVTLGALRTQLESLLAERDAPPRPTPPSSSDALLAQLQKYVPKQLADKMRAAGQIQGDRRQVTVVFADISGFTALSEDLDPEDVASLVNECLKELVLAVYQYEGMVDKFVGDCIMAVFGAPIALEDDAERALRACLAMREHLQDFNRRRVHKLRQPVELHIGVNTGVAIAGNVGSDLRMSYTVMGDTVNVAARLEDAAGAGQIFVSRNTYRLTRGAFGFQAMDPIQVKGKRESLQVYELRQAKVQPDKARGIEGLASPLVGRERERRALVACLEELRKGTGRIVMLVGDAGIGKSRLVAEVRQREGRDLTWLEGRCFAFSRALSYGPFLDLLRRYAGIADEDSEAEARACLRARIHDLFPGEVDAYPILALLLSMRLEPAEAAAASGMVGEAYRTRLFTILEDLLQRLAARRPAVLVLEDLHWADQSSLEMAAHLLPVTRRAPLTVVMLGRPKQEWSGGWEKLAPALKGLEDRYTELSLPPLSGESSSELMRTLLQGSPLPPRLHAAILAKAEGNPFFVEEVLRSLIERGALVREGAEWRVTELVETIQVPDTLQGVLLARLDRLPEETKRVIQKAAVIGRIFLYRVLDHMGRGEADLETQIMLLEDAEMVRERRRVPEIEYIFRHALTQDVAYQTLLAPSRRLLHQGVGKAFEEIFAERIEEFIGLLAYHYFRGEAWERALHYSARAADAAVDLYAYAEAREYCRQALEALKHLPDDAGHLRQRVDVSVRLVNVSLQAESPEKNLALLAEAEATAQSLDDPARLARVQLWIGRAHYLAGRLREAVGYFQKVLAVAPQFHDPELLALPGAVIGRVLFIQGQFAKALHLLDEAVPLLEGSRNHHEVLFARMYRAAARTCLGDFPAGLAELDDLLTMAQASRDQNAETMVHTAMAMIRLTAGKHAEAIDSARDALAVAEQSGDAMFRYSSNAFIAWGLMGLGDPGASLRHWGAAREAAKTLGGQLLLGEWLAAVESETLLGSGDVPSALRRGQEALAIAKAAGSVIAEALAERAIGRALAACAPPRADQAEAHLAESVSLLEGIGAKFDLARSSLALGEVRHACGNPAGAAGPLARAAELAAECGLRREEAAARALLERVKRG